MIANAPAEPKPLAGWRERSLQATIVGYLRQLERDAMVQYAALVTITVLAAGLRLFRLGAWSFWQDEIYTINAARDVWHHVTVFPPPAMSNVLTNAVLNARGTSEWSARISSAVIGTLSVPILYLSVRRLVGAPAALVAAVLLAVAPWHIYWSQNARFYSALLLFYTLALLAFYYGLERDRFRYIAAAVVLLFFAVGERLPALLLIPVLGVYLVLVWLLPMPKPAGLRARNLLPLVALGAVVGVFEVYRVLTKGEWLLSDFLDVFFGHPIADPARIVYEMQYKLGPALIGFGLVSGVSLVHRGRRLGLLLLVAGVLPIVLLGALSPFVFTEDRYAFVTLPAWILLAAVGARDLVRGLDRTAKALGAGIIVALLAASLAGLVLYYTVNEGDQPNWRAAFSLVAASVQPGDVVVSTYPEVGEYYLPSASVERMSDLSPATVARRGQVHWFVLDAKTSWASSELKGWVEQRCALAGVFPSRVPQDQGLAVYRCVPT